MIMMTIVATMKAKINPAVVAATVLVLVVAAVVVVVVGW